MKAYTVGVADDHSLMRQGLVELVNSFGNYQVVFQAGNGSELIEYIEKAILPDIILLDINMPGKDGFETALWLKQYHPGIKVIAVSMLSSEAAILRMLRNGVSGYILKMSDAGDLKEALDSVMKKGFHYSQLLTGHLLHAIQKGENNKPPVLELTEREIEFLKYACTEMTYREIAGKMFVSPRTVDGYRDNLFEKLNVQTRVGLAIFAIKNAIVSIELDAVSRAMS